jgi:hypothetical protein
LEDKAGTACRPSPSLGGQMYKENMDFQKAGAEKCNKTPIGRLLPKSEKIAEPFHFQNIENKK